jgi:hypothetical protein
MRTGRPWGCSRHVSATAAAGNDRPVWRMPPEACRRRMRRPASSGWLCMWTWSSPCRAARCCLCERDLGGGLTSTSATRRTSDDIRRIARRHGGLSNRGLQASEAGIYGRFGYSPAMVERLTVDRREARLHAGSPSRRVRSSNGTPRTWRTSGSGGGCNTERPAARPKCGTTSLPIP